jgi:prepilin-type N-terminal cleavage/methylation domain-containing protein
MRRYQSGEDSISAVARQSRILATSGYAEGMKTPRRIAGYTLIEVIVALLVFTVGALALAASSAMVARAMATNSQRERGGRVAASRIALLKSQCGIAVSGSERVHEIESAWSVARSDRGRVSITETVSYASPRGPRTQAYRTTIWCRG